MRGLTDPLGERDTGTVARRTQLGFRARGNCGQQRFKHCARHGKRQVCQTAIAHLSSRFDDSFRPAGNTVAARATKGSGPRSTGNPTVWLQSAATRLVSGARRDRLHEGARPG